MSTSLLGTVLFFLIKEAYFYAGSLLVTSRCAIRGKRGLETFHIEGVLCVFRQGDIPIEELLLLGLRPLGQGSKSKSRSRSAEGGQPSAITHLLPLQHLLVYYLL